MPSPLSRLALLLAALAGSNFASPASGELPRALWEARVVNAPAVAPVLSGDTLWVVGTDRKIGSHAARTGDRHWRRTLAGQAALPVLPGPEDLLIAAGAPQPSIALLKRADGEALWSQRLHRTPVGIARGESLVFVATGERVEARRRTDGTPRWVRDLEVPLAGIALAGSRLIVLGRRDSLWCLDGVGGGGIWAVGVDGFHPSAPVADDTLVIRLTYDGWLARHDLSTGAIVDRARVAAQQIAPPGVGMGQIAVAGVGGELEALDLASLKRRWSGQRRDTIAAGARRWAGWWLVPTLAGRLLAISPERGGTAWSLAFEEPLSLAPATGPDLLVVIDDRGRLVVYTLEEPS